MRLVSALREGFERLLGTLVVALMASLAIIVVLGVAYRKAGASLVWYDEVASIMLAWLTYYGAALAALKRAHLGFSGIVHAVPLPYRLWLVILAEGLVCGFFVLLAWIGYEVLLALEGDTLISLPSVSVQYTQSVIPIGAALFVVAELLSMPEAWRKAKGIPSPGAAERAREAAGQ